MTVASTIPAFCQGIKHFGKDNPEYEKYIAERLERWRRSTKGVRRRK